MGRGNFLFCKDGINYPTFYIQLETEEDDEMFDEELFCEEDFIETIKSEISKDFCECEYFIDNFKIIGETDNFCLAIADNENSIAISCLLKDEYSELNIEFKNSVNEFFRKLSKLYDLTFRTSAWTSEKIQKSEKNIAYDI